MDDVKQMTREYSDKRLIDLLLQIILFLSQRHTCCDTRSLRDFVDHGLSRLSYRYEKIDPRFFYIVIAYSLMIKLDSLISRTTSDKFLYGDNAILQNQKIATSRSSRRIFLISRECTWESKKRKRYEN